MNEKIHRQNSFRKLKYNILLKVVLIILGSVALGVIFLVVFVDGIFQDSFARFMIDLFRFFGMDWEQANYLYFKVFMNKKSMWMLTGLLVIMAIAFYIALSTFTKYFYEISDGVDKMTDEDDESIKLSSELDFMEVKLNEVKSELKKKEREARESEQRKNDLVLYLAHDIKTPLTSVIGYLSLLSEDPEMPIESRAKYMDITLKKAHRLEELINEFFDITKFNLQTILLDKTNINIELMLRQIADEFYPVLEMKVLKVNIDVEEGLSLSGDSQKLARVFNNIIKNAISYSGNENSINISAESNHGKIIVKITNTGDTIPKDKLDSIFEKFYRLDHSRSSDKGGSGLGLAIAKEIVTAHEGTITAESHRGQTTFTIMLPKNEDKIRKP